VYAIFVNESNEVPPGTIAPNQIPNMIVSMDTLGLFDDVLKMKGFHIAESGRVSSIRGRISDNTGSLWLGQPKLDNMKGGSDEKEWALTAIHELIHFNFDDDALAAAVKIMPGVGKVTGETTSEQWGRVLKKHCEMPFFLIPPRGAARQAK
jgi:hypothetical protein